MNKTGLTLTLIVLTLLTNCKDRTIEDLEEANGKVAGTEWRFKQGNAYFGIGTVETILMSTAVTSNSACSILNPSSPYIKFEIPSRTGTYDIPFDTEVIFHEGATSAKSLSAASGFIQIIAINQFSVDGLIQVSLDDDNDVSGAFFLEVCN